MSHYRGHMPTKLTMPRQWVKPNTLWLLMRRRSQWIPVINSFEILPYLWSFVFYENAHVPLSILTDKWVRGVLREVWFPRKERMFCWFGKHSKERWDTRLHFVWWNGYYQVTVNSYRPKTNIPLDGCCFSVVCFFIVVLHVCSKFHMVLTDTNLWAKQPKLTDLDSSEAWWKCILTYIRNMIFYEAQCK